MLQRVSCANFNRHSGQPEKRQKVRESGNPLLSCGVIVIVCSPSVFEKNPTQIKLMIAFTVICALSVGQQHNKRDL